MNPAILQNPFVTTALPIMFTVLIAAWMNGKGVDGTHKRMDDLSAGLNRRLDEVVRQLERIETKLDDHASRITRQEAETSPLKR